MASSARYGSNVASDKSSIRSIVVTAGASFQPPLKLPKKLPALLSLLAAKRRAVLAVHQSPVAVHISAGRGVSGVRGGWHHMARYRPIREMLGMGRRRQTVSR